MPSSFLPIVFMGSASALSLLGDATLFTVLPSYYPHIGLSPLQVGMLLSLNRWVRLISNRLAERCYRRMPVVQWLTIAFAATAAATASYGLFQAFFALLLARILWGVCFSFIRQAGVMTVTAASEEAHLGRRMGLYRGISMTGWLMGTLFGGFGCDYFGWMPTLVFFGILSLGSVPLGFFSQRGIRQHVPPALPDIRTVRTHRKLTLCGFITGIVGFGLIVSTFGLIVKEQVGTSQNIFGLTIGVATLTGIVLAVQWGLDILGSPVLGTLADRFGRERLLPVVFWIGASAMIMACIPLGLWWLIGCVLAVFLSGALLGVVIASWAGWMGGKGIAAYATGFDFGSALGPLIGWGIAHFGLPIHLIFVAGALFYFGGGVMTFRLTPPLSIHVGG